MPLTGGLYDVRFNHILKDIGDLSPLKKSTTLGDILWVYTETHVKEKLWGLIHDMEYYYNLIRRLSNAQPISNIRSSLPKKSSSLLHYNPRPLKLCNGELLTIQALIRRFPT